jgi:phosphoenolpyruvate carboxylase
MSVATSTLPQVLLKQYEQLAERYANLAADLEHERALRKAIEQELEMAEDLLVRYESAAPGETDPDRKSVV